jgi:DNA-binding MarR family transcriptional regulator
MRKMMRIGRMHRCIFERNISNLGIHHSQHHLLMYISKEKEIPSQKLIAEKFGITPAAVARTLKSLEAEGYIERMSDEEDSRFNKIVITPKGNEVVKQSCKAFEETDILTFGEFSEEELLCFNEYLDRIQSKLLAKNEENCCVRKKNDET